MTTAEEYRKNFLKLFQARKYMDAIEYTSKIISDNPNWSMLAGVYQHRSSCYYNLGIANNDFTYFENAIKDCNKVIELMPDDTFGFSMRADCYVQTQQLEKAINSYSEVIDLCDKEDEMYLNAYLNRIDCYVDINDCESAIKDCKYLLDNEEIFEEYAEYDTFDKIRKLYEELKENDDCDEDDEEDSSEWKIHMENAFAMHKQNPHEAIVEFLKAYVISRMDTVKVLVDMMNDTNSTTYKNFYTGILKLLAIFAENFGEELLDMSKEEKIKFVEKRMEKEKLQFQNVDNIDLLQLHYNPTQGRKLDL